MADDGYAKEPDVPKAAKPKPKTGTVGGEERLMSAETKHADRTTAPGDEFVKIYNAYVNALGDAWMGAHSKMGDTQRAYARDVQGLQLDLQKNAEDAYHSAVKAYQAAAGKPDGDTLRADANRSYADALNDARTAAQRRLEGAQEKQEECVNACRDEFDKRNEAAYRGYLKDLQKAWAAVNVDTLDVKDLDQVVRTTLVTAAAVRR
jgi:hypothetical protein